MSKLRFYYSTMGAGKTSNLLIKAHQFEQSQCDILILKPKFDTRDKDLNFITSRPIKNPRRCLRFDDQTDVEEMVANYFESIDNNRKILFVDEIQFATKEHINQLWRLAKKHNIDVYCYGLKNSYNNRLFEPIIELFIMADTIEEIKSMCCKCTNKATTHLRIVNGEYVFNQDDKVVGDLIGEEKYESVCQVCWNKIYNQNINK